MKENEIPVVKMCQLDEAISSISKREGNSRTDPYLGQPHTHDGARGTKLVEGLTMRDIHDCLMQAFLVSSGETWLSEKACEISNDPDIGKGTPYANKGTWRAKDVFEIDLAELDPIAVSQNLVCFIEHYMGIFPNLINESGGNNDSDN